MDCLLNFKNNIKGEKKIKFKQSVLEKCGITDPDDMFELYTDENGCDKIQLKNDQGSSTITKSIRIIHSVDFVFRFRFAISFI
jgi:hypothetical protein